MFLRHNWHNLTWWPRDVWGTRATMEEQEGGRHHMADFFARSWSKCESWIHAEHVRFIIFIDVYLHMVYYHIMKDENRKYMKNIRHKYLESTWTEWQSLLLLVGCCTLIFQRHQMFHTLSNGACEGDLGDTSLHVSMSFTKESIVICYDSLPMSRLFWVYHFFCWLFQPLPRKLCSSTINNEADFQDSAHVR